MFKPGMWKTATPGSVKLCYQQQLKNSSNILKTFKPAVPSPAVTVSGELMEINLPQILYSQETVRVSISNFFSSRGKPKVKAVNFRIWQEDANKSTKFWVVWSLVGFCLKLLMHLRDRECPVTASWNNTFQFGAGMGVKFGREKQILTCYLFQTHQSHITAFSYTRLSTQPMCSSTRLRCQQTSHIKTVDSSTCSGRDLQPPGGETFVMHANRLHFFLPSHRSDQHS